MTTLPTPGAGDPGPEVTPLIAGPLGGRRRRPSGEPPPLPRHVDHSTRWYLGLGAVAVALWVGMSVPPVLGAITQADLVMLHAVAALRSAWLTHVMLGFDAMSSPWVVRLAAWGTIAALVALRRFRHLAVYLIVLLATGLLATIVAAALGRMRPAGIQILGTWQGYAQPARPVAALALVLVGTIYTLVPAGQWRNRAKWAAAVILGLVCAGRLYLAVDHPTDQVTALILGWALAVVAFRMAVPNDVFPISYHGGRKAHLDIGGRRGEAIVRPGRTPSR